MSTDLEIKYFKILLIPAWQPFRVFTCTKVSCPSAYHLPESDMGENRFYKNKIANFRNIHTSIQHPNRKGNPWLRLQLEPFDFIFCPIHIGCDDLHIIGKIWNQFSENLLHMLRMPSARTEKYRFTWLTFI